ncbi:transporter substrate-binding domain-containing protein [Altericista sp. CCNU0014]|uniref:transporter substrate-binding domain-containing protein n=1 Tax=Altericista sp. CCNU0014 TaxID=3082949 RepID=UPI00384BF70D
MREAGSWCVTALKELAIAAVAGATLSCGCAMLAAPSIAIAAPLDAILQRGRLVVAVKDNLYPLGYRDRDGTLQGFEIAIAKRLAQDWLGSEQAVVLQPVSNAERLTAVASGTVDLAIANITLTQNRTRAVNFSDPYYRNGTGILTQSPRWNSLQALYRQTVAVLEPSVTLPYLKSALPKARLTGVRSYAAGQQLLEADRVRAMVGDRIVLFGLARQNPRYQFFSTQLTVQPLAIAFPKGMQYEPLRDRLNNTLRQWQREGWLDAQRQTWALP